MEDSVYAPCPRCVESGSPSRAVPSPVPTAGSQLAGFAITHCSLTSYPMETVTPFPLCGIDTTNKLSVKHLPQSSVSGERRSSLESVCFAGSRLVARSMVPRNAVPLPNRCPTAVPVFILAEGLPEGITRALKVGERQEEGLCLSSAPRHLPLFRRSQWKGRNFQKLPIHSNERGPDSLLKPRGLA